MARRKTEIARVAQKENGEHADTAEMTRFVWHASDLIQNLSSLKSDIANLEVRIETASENSRLAGVAAAKMAREGVHVEIEGNFEQAHKRLIASIDQRLGEAEKLAVQFWSICALAGCVGGLIGSGIAIIARLATV